MTVRHPEETATGDQIAGLRRGKGVQSIEVGHELIRTLIDSKQPMHLGELAARSAMSPSKAHAYLVSYRQIGMVAKDSATGRYGLGPLAVELGIAGYATHNPVRIAERAIALLRQRGFDAAMFISIWTSRGAMVVASGAGNSAILPFDIRVGYYSSLHLTATGQVCVAHADPGEVSGLLELERAAGAASTILPEPARLTAIAAEIRKSGYRIVADQLIPGMAGIAVPIRAAGGEALGAVLTAILPAGPEAESDMASALINAVHESSGGFGGVRNAWDAAA